MNHNFLITHIAADVCTAFKITFEQLAGKSKKRIYSYPRHIFCYICRMYTDYTFREIGIMIGDRDHTTIMHSAQTAEELIEVNDEKFVDQYWLVYNENSSILSQLKN
jgi:chromosomal replication initiator protein